MKYILISLLLTFEFLSVNAQETAKKSIYYTTDGYKLSRKQKSELNTFIDSVFTKENTGVTLKIHAHTDSAASNTYNIQLSQRRSGEVKKFISRKGVSAVKLEVNNYGESKPRYSYEKPGSMAKNRRVDVEVQYNFLQDVSALKAAKTTILDLYKLLEEAADTFFIDNNFDTVLKARKGIIVAIPANSICIRFNKKRAYKNRH